MSFLQWVYWYCSPRAAQKSFARRFFSVRIGTKKTCRCVLEGLHRPQNPYWGLVYTMDHEKMAFFPWSDLMVQLSWSKFLNQFIKHVGSSLGVNRMWTKRNDHAPKNECANFFNMCPKRAILKKKLSLIIFCFLLVGLLFSIKDFI